MQTPTGSFPTIKIPRPGILILATLVLACGLPLILSRKTCAATPLTPQQTASARSVDNVQPPVRIVDIPTIQLVSAEEEPPNAPKMATGSRGSGRSHKSKVTKNGWVKPVDIVARLKVLDSIGVTRQWSAETAQLIDLLLIEENIRSSESGTVLEQLTQKMEQLDQIISVVSQRFPDLPVAVKLSSELRRLRYDIGKRLAVWKALQRLPSETTVPDSPFALVAGQRISFGQFDNGWKNYLRLDGVEKSFSALHPDVNEQKEAARRSLIRLYSPTLDPSQSAYVHRMLAPSDIQLLKSSASGRFDHYRLIKAIEKYEYKPSGVAAHYINDQFQNLLWSDDPESQQAAREIQTHFRNANIRLTVSDRMLNRLIPSSPSVQQPVSERVMGADVNGHSNIQNSLSVELIPDATRLHLELKTNGRVDSDTVATKSGFEVRNSGLAKFQAFKRFAIDRFGNLDGQSSVAHANANQRLVGIRSKLDPFPVVNWIARRIARKQISEQAPRANMLLEEKVEGSARQQLEDGVQEKVALMQAWLKTNLLQPLIAMDLDPEALQMATTQRRLVMRYRLAGLDQMAANSPRPADAESDYMGVQLHQSLLNNTIERIEISARSFTPETLVAHLADVIGFSPDANSKEGKRDATFVFANYDPIRVDLQDGKVRVELNLKSLRVGKKGKTWRNITIASTYKPEVIGSRIRLAQYAPIEVKGRRFRLGDQIAVRAIFTVVLPKQYTFQTIPARLQENLNGYALAIDQLNIADGWAGVSYQEVPVGYYELPSTYSASGTVYSASANSLGEADATYNPPEAYLPVDNNLGSPNYRTGFHPGRR